MGCKSSGEQWSGMSTWSKGSILKTQLNIYCAIIRYRVVLLRIWTYISVWVCSNFQVKHLCNNIVIHYPLLDEKKQHYFSHVLCRMLDFQVKLPILQRWASIWVHIPYKQTITRCEFLCCIKYKRSSTYLKSWEVPFQTLKSPPN